MPQSDRKNYSTRKWRPGFCYRGDAPAKSQAEAAPIDAEALKAAMTVIEEHVAALNARYGEVFLPGATGRLPEG